MRAVNSGSLALEEGRLPPVTGATQPWCVALHARGGAKLPLWLGCRVRTLYPHTVWDMDITRHGRVLSTSATVLQPHTTAQTTMTSAIMGVPLGLDLHLRRPLIPVEWWCFSHAFLCRFGPTRSGGWGLAGGVWPTLAAAPAAVERRNPVSVQLQLRARSRVRASSVPYKSGPGRPRHARVAKSQAPRTASSPAVPVSCARPRCPPTSVPVTEPAPLTHPHLCHLRRHPRRCGLPFAPLHTRARPTGPPHHSVVGRRRLVNAPWA